LLKPPFTLGIRESDPIRCQALNKYDSPSLFNRQVRERTGSIHSDAVWYNIPASTKKMLFGSLAQPSVSGPSPFRFALSLTTANQTQPPMNDGHPFIRNQRVFRVLLQLFYRDDWH
jgi:hypothetical protein